MEQQNYHCSIQVHTTPQAAYQNIANVSGWWAKDFQGSAFNLGDTFKVTFGTTYVVFEIAEAVPGKKIVWQVRDCYLAWLNNKTEWTGTQVVWTITSIGETAKIDMTHVGLTPQVECYNDCKKGWDGHITQSLFNLASKGLGQPE